MVRCFICLLALAFVLSIALFSVRACDAADKVRPAPKVLCPDGRCPSIPAPVTQTVEPPSCPCGDECRCSIHPKRRAFGVRHCREAGARRAGSGLFARFGARLANHPRVRAGR